MRNKGFWDFCMEADIMLIWSEITLKENANEDIIESKYQNC